jgi:hypothetical protein
LASLRSSVTSNIASSNLTFPRAGKLARPVSDRCLYKMCVCHLYTIRYYTILHVYCVCLCVCVCVLDIEDLNMMQLDLQVIFLRIKQNKMFEVKGC